MGWLVRRREKGKRGMRARSAPACTPQNATRRTVLKTQFIIMQSFEHANGSRIFKREFSTSVYEF